MSFLPRFRPGAGSFNIKNFPLLEYRRFHLLSELDRSKERLFHFFTLYGIHYPHLDQFYYFRKLVLIACFSQKICHFLFLSAMSEKRQSAISKILKFTGSVYRVIQSQKTISLAKISFTKQFILIDLWCRESNHLKLQAQFQEYLKVEKSFPPRKCH